MTKIEAIQLGQEWLANSPPFDGANVGPDCMRGTAGCVCRACCRRIVGRGCDLKRIANVPVWDATKTDVCDLCGISAQKHGATGNGDPSCRQCGGLGLYEEHWLGKMAMEPCPCALKSRGW